MEEKEEEGKVLVRRRRRRSKKGGRERRRRRRAAAAVVWWRWRWWRVGCGPFKGVIYSFETPLTRTGEGFGKILLMSPSPACYRVYEVLKRDGWFNPESTGCC
jgi:hypothetical protein